MEISLTSPRHKSCAVTIEDHIVITGGTMLGLGRVKPAWLAEIGTRTAESYDGTSWRSLPSLSRAKVLYCIILCTVPYCTMYCIVLYTVQYYIPYCDVYCTVL